MESSIRYRNSMFTFRLHLLILILFLSAVDLRYIEDDMLLFWRRANAGRCKPFSTFWENCNKCICGADRLSYCTKMGCDNYDSKQGSDDSKS